MSSVPTKASCSYNQGIISCDGTAAGCSAFDENANALSELYQSQSLSSVSGNSATSLVKLNSSITSTGSSANNTGTENTIYMYIIYLLNNIS